MAEVQEPVTMGFSTGSLTLDIGCVVMMGFKCQMGPGGGGMTPGMMPFSDL